MIKTQVHEIKLKTRTIGLKFLRLKWNLQRAFASLLLGNALKAAENPSQYHKRGRLELPRIKNKIEIIELKTKGAREIEISFK